MRILVTGGAGYIGSVAAAALVRAGHDVVVFDNLFQGHRSAVPPGVPLVVGDLRDQAAVARLFSQNEKFDGIMHFASYTLVGESMTEPLLYLRDNLLAGANLLELSESAMEDIRAIPITTTMCDARPAGIAIGRRSYTSHDGRPEERRIGWRRAR